jgi:hypothetical protein
MMDAVVGQTSYELHKPTAVYSSILIITDMPSNDTVIFKK